MGKAQAAARADDSEEQDSAEAGSEEEDNEEEESDVGSDESDGDRQQRVQADVEAMRQLMADMDKVKMRLQFRFVAERRAKQEALAREQRERDLVEEARRAAEETVRVRKVETSMQTETEIPPQQVAEEECNSRPAEPTSATRSSPEDHESSSRVKKPAGLSLYDLVKASGFDLSRRSPSPVRQADVPEEQPQPPKEAELAPQAPSEAEQQSSFANQWKGDSSKWHRPSPQQIRDSLNNSDVSSHNSPPRSTHSNLPRLNSGRWSSTSNSLASVADGDPAVSPRSQTSTRMPVVDGAVAALLSASRASQLGVGLGDKTEAQREQEAIQCLLFDR